MSEATEPEQVYPSIFWEMERDSITGVSWVCSIGPLECRYSHRSDGSRIYAQVTSSSENTSREFSSQEKCLAWMRSQVERHLKNLLDDMNTSGLKGVQN